METRARVPCALGFVLLAATVLLWDNHIVLPIARIETVQGQADRLVPVHDSQRLPAATTARASSPVKGMTANPALQWWHDPVHPQPDSWWGITQTATTLGDQIALLQQLGVKSYRFELPWPFVAPTMPGGTRYDGTAARDPTWRGYNWTRLDLIVQLLTRAGIAALPQVVYSPTWASGVAATTGGGPNAPPLSSQYYADFLTALVTRYHSHIHTWELWNEPDAGNTWKGSLVQYVTLILKPGYRAVKAVDPSATVVLAGLTSASTLSQVYAAGGKSFFDVANIHHYSRLPDWRRVQAAVRTAQSILGQNGDGHKPLWLTEFGIMTRASIPPGWAYTSPTEQARYITDVYAYVTALRIYFYQLADTNIYGPGGRLQKQTFWGVVTHDLTGRKPGFVAYRTAP